MNESEQEATLNGFQSSPVLVEVTLCDVLELCFVKLYMQESRAYMPFESSLVL